jgi:hypothetical protein
MCLPLESSRWMEIINTMIFFKKKKKHHDLVMSILSPCKLLSLKSLVCLCMKNMNHYVTQTTCQYLEPRTTWILTGSTLTCSIYLCFMLPHTNKSVEQKIANIILLSESCEHSLTAMNEKSTKCSQIIRKFRLNIS